MLLVVIKALTTPVLVVVCALITRRWGASVGGWMLGLPLTSGPVSFFLLVEHGPRFAENSARAALARLARGSCVLRELRCHRQRARLEAVADGGGNRLHRSHVGAGARASRARADRRLVGGLVAGARGSPGDERPGPRRRASQALSARQARDDRECRCRRHDDGCGALGPQASGLLAPLPVLAGLTAASAHREGQRDAAVVLLRGTVLGLWGAAAFFVAVAVTPSAPRARS